MTSFKREDKAETWVQTVWGLMPGRSRVQGSGDQRSQKKRNITDLSTAVGGARMILLRTGRNHVECTLELSTGRRGGLGLLSVTL